MGYYIERELLKTLKFSRNENTDYIETAYRTGWNEGLNVAGALDAIEVIKCKNCSLSYIVETWRGNTYRYCSLLSKTLQASTDMLVNDDDFCSRGKEL